MGKIWILKINNWGEEVVVGFNLEFLKCYFVYYVEIDFERVRVEIVKRLL